MKHVIGKNKGKIVLFALSTCIWCQKVKNLLNHLGVEYYYEDIDLLEGNEREKAIREVKKWNPNLSFPTLIINDKDVIIGYNEGKIKEILKEK